MVLCQLAEQSPCGRRWKDVPSFQTILPSKFLFWGLRPQTPNYAHFTLCPSRAQRGNPLRGHLKAQHTTPLQLFWLGNTNLRPGCVNPFGSTHKGFPNQQPGETHQRRHILVSTAFIRRERRRTDPHPDR
jgi:hypothetical protein